jgi:hypothetical protein
MLFMFTFAPETLQAVARHTRSMLKGIKRRPKNSHELAAALAAAKIVVATLDAAARQAGLSEDLIAAGDQLAEDNRKVMDLVRW